MDKRILIISNIGCAPPFMGNRIRMRALLNEIRGLGFEIHFAGIQLSSPEIEATHPYIDKWITNFKVQKKREHWYKNNRSSVLLRKARKLISIITPQKTNFKIDDYFKIQWENEIKQIEEKYRYKRVMVPYVFNSAFLEYFESADIKVIDTHDIFAGRNEKLRKKNIPSTWFSTSLEEEQKGLLRANRIISIQPKEEKYFTSILDDRAKVKTVRHFIEPKRCSYISSKRTVYGFIGSSNPINEHAVKWFIREVLPEIKKTVPNSSFLLAGSVCTLLKDSEDIHKMGVIDNVKDFYEKCSFTVNPMRSGTGLKIKTIESLSYGRPVIGTDIAAEGLDEFVGNGIDLCISKDEFIQAITKRLQIDRGNDNGDSTEVTISEIQRMNKESRENLLDLLM